MMLVFVKNVSATVWPTNASMMNSLGTGAVLIAEKIQQDQNARLLIKIRYVFYSLTDKRLEKKLSLRFLREKTTGR